MPLHLGPDHRRTVLRSVGERLRSALRWGALVGLLLAAACASGNEDRPGALEQSRDPGVTQVAQPSCTDGASRQCTADLGTRAGVSTCFSGTQKCDEGAWGPCERVTKPTAGKLGGALGRLALGDVSVECENNPCDPTCRNFIARPAEGLVAELDPSGVTTRMDATLVWRGGSALDLPPESAGGVCYSADDCGYGQTCGDVATEPACAHNKCREGAALGESCDPCVADVCRLDPTCCTGGCGLGEFAGPGGESCYYPAADVALGWATAQRACRSRGRDWDLVAVSSPAERELLANLGTGTFWIGLDDQDGTGEWHWSNGEPVTETGGLDTTPPASAPETCVAADAVSGAWSAGACLQSLPFVCEGPSAVPTTCSHEPCAEGAALDSECDPCVTRICESEPACCTEAWDSSCVQLVQDTCQRVCACPAGSVVSPDTTTGTCLSVGNGTAGFAAARGYCQAIGQGWDLAVIQTEAEDTWLAAQASGATPTWIGLSDEDEDGAPRWVSGAALDPASLGTAWSLGPEEAPALCVHQDGPGAWTYAPCGDPAAFVCEGPPSAERSWSQACVERVESTCASTCDASQVATAARCVPWSPGEINTSCEGYDLTLGIPCVDTVPVCNRGSSEVPAGVQLVHFPVDSVDSSTCAPDVGQGTICTTHEPIPPGRCIAVTDCPDLNEARDILVNPEGSAHVDECTCSNNWTRYVPGLECQEEPSCYSTRMGKAPSPSRAHVFFVVERSSQMLEDGGVAWAQVDSALGALFASPEAAGVDAALEFFPSEASDGVTDGCFSDGTCSKAAYDCANPSVRSGVLGLATGSGDAQEAALLAALDGAWPSGPAPVSVALEAALTTMRDAAVESPSDTYAVVLLGLGTPDTCVTDTSYLVALADYFYREWGILTFTAAARGADDAVMAAIAEAGGMGTYRPLTGWDSSAAGLALLEDLSVATGSVPSCTVEIGKAETSDPKRAVVRYVHGDGSSERLYRVADGTDCSTDAEGWYYDDPTDPTSLTLCPATCSLVQADAGAEVHVELACLGNPAPALRATWVSEVYESDCPEGTQVQWGFLGYSASTPSDSRIDLAVRAAARVEDLASADMQPVKTISHKNGNERCQITNGCFIDLWNALDGTPTAQQPVLECGALLVPSRYNETPVLMDWQIMYSCPAAE